MHGSYCHASAFFYSYGNGDYKAMKPYIDIADNTKANAMNKFDLL